MKPDDAELRRAMRDEGCNIERPHPDQRNVGPVGREPQRPAAFIGKGRLGLNPGSPQQRQGFLKDASLGNGDDDGFGHWWAALKGPPGAGN